MRGARGLRDEFSTFHALAYPQLAAQTLAITGDAGITRAAAAATLMRVWRSWPSLRGTADVLVRARWTAVLVAAERESTTPVRPQQAGDAVQEITGAAVAADTVVVAALQRLPRVQRRALVLHYMGGVSVRHLSELSGSSAEHIELLLDDGFTALAGSLVWSAADDEHEDLDGPDMSFDWVSEALADTAARLPAQIPAPPPTVLLRNAAVVRWSVRAIPVAGVAACAAVVAAVALPEPAEVHGPAIYVQHGSGAEGVAPIYVSGSDLAPEPAVDGGPSPEPTVRLRSIALTSLLDTPPATRPRRRADLPPEARLPARATSPRAPTGGSADGAATGPMDAGSGGAAGEDGPREAAGSAESAGAGIAAGDAAGAGAGGAAGAGGPAGTAAGGRRDAAGALTGWCGQRGKPRRGWRGGAVRTTCSRCRRTRAAAGAAGHQPGGSPGRRGRRPAGRRSPQARPRGRSRGHRRRGRNPGRQPRSPDSSGAQAAAAAVTARSPTARRCRRLPADRIR